MIEPMLAQPFRGNIEDAMLDENLWFEQKLDGVRVMVTIADGVIDARSRMGKKFALPDATVKEMGKLFGDTTWTFDGEFYADSLWIFDVMEINGQDCTGVPLEARKNGLVKVFDKFKKPPLEFKLLKAARTPEEKHALYQRTIDGNLEGVMVKDKRRQYFAGKRMRWWRKAKHTESVDVVVMETGRGETGRAVTIGLYTKTHPSAPSTLVEVAGCKIPRDDLIDQIECGTVIEVKYLYATSGSRLYQPVFIRIRDDKAPTDCLLEGLKLPDKQTVAFNK